MRMVDRSPPRRWLRFSLAALLSLVTLIAFVLGIQADRAMKQRRAVEMVLSHGGEIKYEHEESGDVYEDINPAAPRWLADWIGEDFFRTAVGVSIRPEADRGIRHLTGDEMARLAGLPQLKYLQLWCDITDDDLRHVRSLRNLESLILTDAKISDAGMQHLARLPRLDTLMIGELEYLPAGLISDAGLAALRERKLQRLILEKARVTDRGLEQIADLSQLDVLRIGYAPDAPASLAWLARCPKLDTLELRGVTMTDQGWASLAACPTLGTIRFFDSRIADAGLRELGALPALRVLALKNSPIEGQGLEALTRLKSLEIKGSAASPAALSSLQSLHALAYLELNSVPLADAELDALATLHQLNDLRIKNVPLADDALARLAPLTRTELTLVGTGVTPAGAEQFKAQTGRKIRVAETEEEFWNSLTP